MDDLDIEIHDYGFSAMTEDEVKKAEKDLIEKQNSDISETQRKLQGFKKMIWPFLEHLKSDSQKPYIFWPNRSIKIDELQRKIENFIGV